MCFKIVGQVHYIKAVSRNILYDSEDSEFKSNAFIIQSELVIAGSQYIVDTINVCLF